MNCSYRTNTLPEQFLGCGVALIYSFHKSCFNHNEREKLPTYIGKKSTKPHEISNFIYKRKNAHI